MLPDASILRRYLLPLMTVCLAVGILWGRLLPSVGLVLPPLVLLLVGALLSRGAIRRVALLALMVCIGAVDGYGGFHPRLPAEGSYTLSGVVAEEIHVGERGQIRTVLRNVTLDGKPIRLGAYWTFYAEEVPQGLTPGVRVALQAEVYHPTGAVNPGGYDFRAYLLQQRVGIGVYGSEALSCSASPEGVIGWIAAARHAMAEQLERTMGTDAGSWAAAVLLGVKSLVPQSDQIAFQRLGMVHLLTVSGYHVGVLYTLVQLVLRLFPLSRRRRLLPLTGVLGAYCLLTGLHPPVVRAALLALLAEVGLAHGRQRSALHLLCGTAMVILLVSPVQLLGASFQLTYGALVGILLVAPRLRIYLGRRHPRFGKRLGGVTATFGAQLGVLLPQLYWFHELPMLGIVANLLLLPIFSLLLGGCWLALAVCWVPGVGQAVGQVMAAAVQLLTRAVASMGQSSWLMLWTRQATWWTALGWVLLCLGLFGWPERRRWPCQLAVLCGLVVMVGSVWPIPYAGTRYLQLSVGDADAAVFQDGGKTYVIDTGEDGQTLAAWLHQQRASVDALLITHLHSDHAGGVRALLDRNIPVQRCYLPWDAEQSDIDPAMSAVVAQLAESGTEIITLARGDVLALPHGSLTVLWPERDGVRPGRDANLYSMALLAELRGSTMLLAGDLDGTYENYVAVPADVLKVAHHGSFNSTSETFLQKVAPQVTVVSCGREIARTLGAACYQTGVDGAVILQFDDGGFTVETVVHSPVTDH